MFDRVLVPVDQSDVSTLAGEAAVALCRRFGADLHVVHVVDTDELPLGTEAAMIEDLVARGEELVAAVEATAEAADVPVTTAVLRDGAVPHRGIVDYAEDHDVDLVVMGSHGRRGLGRFVLGSVAEWTLRRSPAPVLTLHDGSEFDPDVEEVVVPTDGSDTAERAADLAAAFAAATGARLHAVHVVDLGILWEEADVGRVVDTLQDAGQRAVDRVADRATEAGVDRVETAVLQGTPHREVVDYAADHDADLVVIGTHGRSGLERYLLGSVAERVVRLSDTPVLAVRGTAPD